MSKAKFVKLFRIDGTEMVVRKRMEMVDGKRQFSIKINAYFDEYIPLGYMPEFETILGVCCMQHLDQAFDAFDGVKAKELCEELRKKAKEVTGKAVNRFNNN
ncbi:hypothetical protein VB796_06690 [Arcicella sp. LKC2W]|uniref:hypothetical protein n=1 Tax=Arcicella sp. LKC2W TaxID=2984198 RepID=UPI002B20E0C2|nr:hypothetical protein [Arcicella sp. LKC2W]MEA5458715.1 hypothetical protein [Arcicella sp. LKC2W]